MAYHGDGTGEGTAPTGKKRKAGETPGQEKARRKSKGMFSKSSPFSSPAVTGHEDEEEVVNPTAAADAAAKADNYGLPIQLTPAQRLEQQQKTANMIDMIMAADREKEQEAAFAKSYPAFNTEIKPDDPLWISKRTEIKNQLAVKAVSEVLQGLWPADKDGCEDYRVLQLLPPTTEDAILESQRENTQEYKVLLSTTFKGEKDNLATKIAMIHFGLPVEPLTLNNILGADTDEDDLPDPAEPLPRVQRIMWSEKPLEFLDTYHERSFGFPMLRRAKYRRPLDVPVPQDHVLRPLTQADAQGMVPQPVDNHHHLHHHHRAAPTAAAGAPMSNRRGSDTPASKTHHRHNAPIRPTGIITSMRGGAGIPTSTFCDLCTHFGTRSRLEANPDVSAEDFLEEALEILHLHPDSDWSFFIDQYNNQEPNKKIIDKPFVRSFTVTRSNFDHIYDQYLKARISDRLEDWTLVAEYRHKRLDPSATAPPTFRLPDLIRNGKPTRGPLPDEADRPPYDPTAGYMPRKPFFEKMFKIYGTDGEHREFGNSASDFTTAVASLLGLKHADWPIWISFYSKHTGHHQDHHGGQLFSHSQQFTHASNVRIYNNRIAPRITPDNSNSTIVAHLQTENPPVGWPMRRDYQTTYASVLTAAPNAPATAPLFCGVHGLQTHDDAEQFMHQAMALQIDVTKNFNVDFYSNHLMPKDADQEYRTWNHTIVMSAAGSPDEYNTYVRHRLFDPEQSWDVVFRNGADQAADFRRFPVAEKPVEPDVPIIDTSGGDTGTQSSGPPSYPSPTTSDDTMSDADSLPAANPKPDNTSTGPPVLHCAKGHIFGYWGKVDLMAVFESKKMEIAKANGDDVLRDLDDDEEYHEFQLEALALLALTAAGTDMWHFYVDIHNGDTPTTLVCRPDDAFEIYQNHIRPAVRADGIWPIFLHMDHHKVSTTTLEPPASLTDIVRITSSATGDLRKHRTAYWKIPRHLNKRYAVNQVADQFFRAMQVINVDEEYRRFGADSFLFEKTNNAIEYPLGFAGMELTADIWKNTEKMVRGKPKHYIADVSPAPTGATDCGVRLAGTHHTGLWNSQTTTTHLASEILNLCEKYLAHNALPHSITVWRSARERERFDEGCVVEVDKVEYMGNDLQMFNDRYEGESDAPTNSYWFKANWKTFTVNDLAHPENPPVAWNPRAPHKGPTMKAFREELKQLLGDHAPAGKTGFAITVPAVYQRFVIDDTTTEEQWCKNIFQCFLGSNLFVQRCDITATLDTSTPWGLPDLANGGYSPKFNMAYWTVFPGDDAPSRLDVDDGTPGLTSGRASPEPESEDDYTPEQDPRTAPVIQPPYVPRPAVVIPGAKRAMPRPTHLPKFDTWQDGQNAQNTLQQRSWMHELSVIEPGYQPAAPIFGDNLEIPLGGGSNLPTVYAQHLTPTDYHQLKATNRKLLNQVLDRAAACPFCPESFAIHDVDAKRAHFAMHADTINSAGNCPTCGDNTWRFMTAVQKRDHLLDDQSKRETAEMKAFWESMRCPICDSDFRYLKPDDVVAHMAAHIPGVIKHCDRCSVDLLVLSPAEKTHHDHACVSTMPADKNLNPLFCDHCGEKKNADGTSTADHTKCGSGRAWYCIRDGMNLAQLTTDETAAHAIHCRTPRGFPRTFCKRCGENLTTMTDLIRAYHRNSCYLKVPTGVASAKPGASANEKLRVKNAKDLADIKAQRLEITRKEIEIEKMNADLGTRCKEFAAHHNLLLGDEPCPVAGCEHVFTNAGRADVILHLRINHAGPGRRPALNHPGRPVRPNDTADMGLCPVQGCLFILGTKSRLQIKQHLASHGELASATEKGSSGVTLVQCPLLISGRRCEQHHSLANDSAALAVHDQHHGANDGDPYDDEAINAALKEFKRRMPEFQRDHDALQRLANKAAGAVTLGPPSGGPSAEEIAATQRLVLRSRGGNITEHPRRQAAEDDRLARLAIAEQNKLDAAHKAKDTSAARVALDALAKINHQHATQKFAAEKAGMERLATNKKLADEQKAARDAQAIAAGKEAEAQAAKATAEQAKQDGQIPSITTGGNTAERHTTGPDTIQIGFAPSPTSSNATIPSRRGAPSTDAKRKKAALDENEEHVSVSALHRSASKKDTKKMRFTSGVSRMASVRKTERGEEEEGFSGTDVSLLSAPRRMTRAASGTPGARRAGRPRVSVMMGRGEEMGEGSGFEDVSEEEDKEGEEEVPSPLKKGRKSLAKE